MPLKPDIPTFNVVTPPTLSRKRQTLPSECSGEIFPECLQDLYHIPTAPASASGNSLGVTGYLGEFASEDDLNVRLSQFYMRISQSC